MMKALKFKILIVTLHIFLISGCATTISSYPVSKDGKNREGGIPYYMPKHVLLIKQPIEIVRKEKIFAVISLGGIEEFLYPIKHSDFEASIEKLSILIKVDPNSIKIEEIKSNPIYLTEVTSQTGENKKESKKYSPLASATAKSTEKKLLTPYSPSDIDKAISIVTIPDENKLYELVIDPSWFSSLEVGVTLKDGWRLDSLTSKSGENQIVGALKDIATTIIGARKDVDIANIGKDQALKLKELEIASKAKDEDLKGFVETTNIAVKIKGYVKKTEIETLKPGAYNMSQIMDLEKPFTFPTIKAELIQPIQL